MPRFIQVGRVAAGASSPDIRSVGYANGQTFLQGAPLVSTLGVVSECAANPVSICGFAAEPAGSKAGYNAANSPTVITGRVQEVSMYTVFNSQLFTAWLVNASAVLVAPTVADIQTAIGLSKQVIQGVSTWVADKAATACIQIIDVDVDLGIVFFKVRPAQQQII